MYNMKEVYLLEDNEATKAHKYLRITILSTSFIHLFRACLILGLQHC